MQFAKIDIDAKQVTSNEFNDTYFSKDNALSEKRYVFLGQNNIPDIWQNRDIFTIGEHGFGLGLNFLLTFKTLIEDKNRAKKLIYYSFDIYPIKIEDLKKVYQNFLELQPFLTKLLEFYENLQDGVNIFEFKEDNIKLIFIVDEAFKALDEFNNIDVWFLDGFAPSKNSELYTEKIFEKIDIASSKNARFSTYSSAGVIKRGMQNIGFEVSKVKGYGVKRHMLIGKKI